MLLSPASTSASLPSQPLWAKFKPKNEENDVHDKQAQMTLPRQRLLTLAYDEMETIRMLPNSYAELDAVARDWIDAPPEANFSLRIPFKYASMVAARLEDGPYIDLTDEDSYQIAVLGVQGSRVEIVSDAPPPSSPPPPPSVVEMPPTLTPGEHVARLVTLAYGDMETVGRLPNNYAQLYAVARNWIKLPPEAVFILRVPVDYASLEAARMIAGPYIYLTGEDSYQIASIGVSQLHVEIFSDAPLEPLHEPPPPPPPPVLKMHTTFNMKLAPGKDGTRSRLTLAYGDMEAVGMLPRSYGELDAVARDWIKLAPEAIFSLRVPVNFVSLQAARLVAGPYIYLTGEDSYQIAIKGVNNFRVEIVGDPPPPPPPPPATSIPSYLDNRKSPKEWPQSAGKEDINFDALSEKASFPAAEDVLDVESARRILSAIRKVMEDLKADASQILPADEAAARLHTIFDPIFSSNRSCKALLNFQGDDAKIVLNSFQWLLDYPQSNSTQRSRLLSALLRLSRKSGLYPECIILKDIVREDDCAVASGHFGEVWKGKFRDQQVCLKVVKIYKQSHLDHLLKVFAKEAILWSQLSHPNLLPFYGIYYLEDGHGRVCLVSPWMNNGNIMDYLPKNPWVNRVLLVSDVAAGVSYLHQKAIVHGDLKGVNILVTESGKACLADFGLSNHVDAEMLTWTSESSANTGGTVRWQAPELLNPENGKSKSTKETDVYAFSCVCYEIFTCQVPFHEIPREFTVMMKVMEGKRPSRPAKNSSPFVEWGLTDSIWRLMERCWDQNPESRPTISHISGEDFLSSLVDDRPSGGGDTLSPPQFRGAMHGFS